MLGVAWVLFMTTRAVERRRGGTRKERRAAAREAGRPDAVAPAASAPSLRQGTRPAARPAPASRGGDDDFSDIEAILKKHGI
ncbi:hypothetical protein QFZ55_001562 [Streptomyces luteogriseus]|nr:hypothetical protein [Streptomyces luteogriseus]